MSKMDEWALRVESKLDQINTKIGEIEVKMAEQYVHQSEMDHHEREHEKAREELRTNRRWMIGQAMALAVYVASQLI